MVSGGRSGGREARQGEARQGEATQGQGPTKRAMWRKAREAVKQSAWAPLGGKAAAYVAGFFALALVGSGDMLRLLPLRGGGGAEAALLYGASVAGSPAADAGAGAEAHTHAGPGAEMGAEPHARTAADAGTAADAAADAGAVAEAGPAGGGITPDGKVVLNLATAEDLQRLPGVGPSKAKAILALRAKLKRFRKVEDLRLVKGIGRRSLERLRPLVLIDPP